MPGSFEYELLACRRDNNVLVTIFLARKSYPFTIILSSLVFLITFIFYKKMSYDIFKIFFKIYLFIIDLLKLCVNVRTCAI